VQQEQVRETARINQMQQETAINVYRSFMQNRNDRHAIEQVCDLSPIHFEIKFVWQLLSIQHSCLLSYFSITINLEMSEWSFLQHIGQ